MREHAIVLLPGDGIGPEVVRAAVTVLRAAAEKYGIALSMREMPIGGFAIDTVGSPLPQETVDACRAAEAVLLGAVGGPKWDGLPGARRPEAGLLGIRSALGLYANLRPAVVYRTLREASPLKAAILGEGLDILVVRELTGGLYFGKRGRVTDEQGNAAAYDTEQYSVPEIRRITRVAFEAARKRKGRLMSVDKANVLESSRLWREEVTAMAADYPDVQLSHMYVDNAAMQLVRAPGQFDVMVTSNLFGDILSDEASMITGSIGMLPSASLGDGTLGLYEPIHGSAPDIAGKDIANPLATILSAAMMLRYSLREPEAADAIEKAVERVLEAGWRTADLVGAGEPLGMRAMAGKVAEALV